MAIVDSIAKTVHRLIALEDHLACRRSSKVGLQTDQCFVRVNRIHLTYDPLRDTSPDSPTARPAAMRDGVDIRCGCAKVGFPRKQPVAHRR